jgi:Protein of unknown function (DUF3667)
MKINCPNCEKKMPEKAVFCPKCGQKTATAKVRLRDLLWKLWMTTFHLDNKFFRAIFHLAVPGKVTIAYFKGQIKRYPHPIQFFFVCFLFFFFYLSVKKNGSFGPEFKIFQLFGNESAESLRGKVDLVENFEHSWDSLPPTMQTPQNRVLMDSLVGISSKNFQIFLKDSTDFKEIVFFTNRNLKMSYKDLLELSADSVIQKYGVNSFTDKLILRQALKAAKDTDGIGRFWVASITWMILGQISVMAFWLYWLYYRQKRFYVEHFVLQLHGHTFLIFSITILGFCRHFFGLGKDWIWLAMAWFFGGMYYAMWKIYGQSWKKTLLKWGIFVVLYMILLILLFCGSIFTSLLLF